MVKYLTQKAYEKLKKELNYLETEKRKEVAEDLRRAISFGDLSENAAYDDAKDAKSFLEGRIAELKNLLATAKIVSKEDNDRVQIGSQVTVAENEGKGERVIFRIVDSTEVDVSKGMISGESPLGKALLGRKEGDKVQVITPAGKITYKIIKIEDAD